MVTYFILTEHMQYWMKEIFDSYKRFQVFRIWSNWTTIVFQHIQDDLFDFTHLHSVQREFSFDQHMQIWIVAHATLWVINLHLIDYSQDRAIDKHQDTLPRVNGREEISTQIQLSNFLFQNKAYYSNSFILFTINWQTNINK